MKRTCISQASESDAGASRLASLQKFQLKTGISFHNQSLLDIAFTHRSSINESHPDHDDNERLEFLGDSVLGVCIAHILFDEFQERREGDLARMKSVLVSESSLAEIAASLGISEHLILGKGEEMSGGRQKPALLADATEALLGAYYLDAGLEAVRELVQRLFRKKIRELASTSGKDFKSIMQEYAQKLGMDLPVYSVVRSEGPEHARLFFVSCSIGGKTIGPFPGRTKKEAEQRAARQAFDLLRSDSPDDAKLLDSIAGGD